MTRDIEAYGLAAAKHLLPGIEGEGGGDVETRRRVDSSRAAAPPASDRRREQPPSESTGAGSEAVTIRLTLNRISD